MPQELLKRIPGLEHHNLMALLRKGKQHGINTIVDLCRADEDTLSEVVGRKCAQDIIEFLNKKVEFEDVRL